MLQRYSRVPLTLIIFLALAPFSLAYAEKRVALVIGNGQYRNVGTLTNPRSDAAAMAAALKRLGFDVIEAIDLDKGDLDRRINQFRKLVAGVDVALLFYAGHGIQVAGQNYLIPVDATLSEVNDVDFEALSFRYVFQSMEIGAKARIVFLDACRNNPFEDRLSQGRGRGMAIGNGLAPVTTIVGSFIGFATAPGDVASDGSGTHSPFTAALLHNIESPSLDISELMINVRNEVMQATNSAQVPWDHSSLTRRFFFRPDMALAQTGTLAQTAREVATDGELPKPQDKTTVIASSRSIDERQDLLEFIRLFTHRWNESELDPELFAPTVGYYEQGIVPRDKVIATVRDYFKRWPKRKFSPNEQSLRFKSMGDDIFEVDYLFGYEVRNASRRISGTGDYYMTLKRSGASFQILRLDEKVMERHRDKFLRSRR